VVGVVAYLSAFHSVRSNPSFPLIILNQEGMLNMFGPTLSSCLYDSSNQVFFSFLFVIDQAHSLFPAHPFPRAPNQHHSPLRAMYILCCSVVRSKRSNPGARNNLLCAVSSQFSKKHEKKKNKANKNN
jgi:hypothetical protein